MRPATHRGVEEGNARAGKLISHGAGGIWVTGGHVGDDAALLQAGGEAIRGKNDLAYLLGGRQARHYQVALCRQRTEVLAGNAAKLGKSCHRLRTQVIEAQPMFAQEPTCQRCTHIAKADVTKLHYSTLQEFITREALRGRPPAAWRVRRAPCRCRRY